MNAADEDKLERLVREYGNTPVAGEGRRRGQVWLDILAMVRGQAVGRWTLKPTGTRGVMCEVFDADGKRIAEGYQLECRMLVDAHNASLPNPASQVSANMALPSRTLAEHEQMAAAAQWARENGYTVPSQWETGKSTTCTVPPAGWRCTREAGHDGPCAAIPDGCNCNPGECCPACDPACYEP